MENICCEVQTNRDGDQCRWHGQVRSDCPGRICRAVWWRSEVSERNIKHGSRSAWAVRGHQADPVSSPTAPNRALCHWQQTVDRPARVLSQLNEHWASTNERRRRQIQTGSRQYLSAVQWLNSTELSCTTGYNSGIGLMAEMHHGTQSNLLIK